MRRESDPTVALGIALLAILFWLAVGVLAVILVAT